MPVGDEIKTHIFDSGTKASALDLLMRAAQMTSAIRSLSLPYNYHLLNDPLPKRQVREKLGMGVVPILEEMRDRILDEVCERWLEQRTKTRNGENRDKILAIPDSRDATGAGQVSQVADVQDSAAGT